MKTIALQVADRAARVRD